MDAEGICPHGVKFRCSTWQDGDQPNTWKARVEPAITPTGDYDNEATAMRDHLSRCLRAVDVNDALQGYCELRTSGGGFVTAKMRG